MGRYKLGTRKTLARNSKLPNRSLKRKQWSEEQMLVAIDGITKSINKEALEHGVPTSTLKDRISGCVVHGIKPDPVPYLSAKEDDNLKRYLVEACHMRYGKTRSQVKGVVEKVAIEKGILRSP